MAGRLDGKVAIVTGGTSGIGAAIARAFAAEGADVTACGIETEEGEAFAAETDGVRFSALDVREEAEWEQIIAATMARSGRLDILVNNAGITGQEQEGVPHDPEHASLDDWREVHAVNLDGTFLGCKHAITAMRATGTGSIINMSSRSGLVGVPATAAYASAKAAVRNHTKSVALWCAEQGLAVRCNSVHPAAIDTAMWGRVAASRDDDEDDKPETGDAPLGRLGRPEEVAMVCVMLASDECPYMTGAEIVIDGGVLAGAGGPGKH